MQESEAEYGTASGGGRMVPGSVVILGVVAISFAAAVFSWFYYRRLQERPLALWGGEAASLILNAPVARLYRLTPEERAAVDAEGDTAPAAEEARGAESADAGAPADAAARHFTIGGARYVAEGERDISAARGFSHVRQGLIHDRSFAWDDDATGVPARWDYAIEFDDQHGGETAIAFDFRGGYVIHIGNERRASIRPVAAAIKVFLDEQYPATK